MQLHRWLCVAAVVGATTVVNAQTSAGLLIAPWQDDTYAEISAEAFIFNGGHTDSRTSDSVRLQLIEARGRAALSPNDPHLRFGSELFYLNIDSDDPALPERLVDQSHAIGFGITQFDGWEVGAVVGFGYAGNNPYGDSEALYGLANLIFSYRIDDDQSVQFLVNYNGNRTIFPDAPLPGIVYNHRVNDTLSYSVGFPYSSITWKPIDRLTLDLSYAITFTLRAHADYEFVDNWHVFGGFTSSHNAFTIDDDPREHRRLFFSQRRLETGIRWQSSPRCHVLLAGGYAFDQKFEYGYDTRDLDTVRDLSDEPYLRMSVGFSF